MDNLKQGEKLRWKWPSVWNWWHIKCYFRWRKRHGKTVEFVAYTDERDLRQKDQFGFPILHVKTKVGVMVFSSGYFSRAK